MDIAFFDDEFTDDEQAEIIEAIEFYGEQLLNPRTAKTVSIDIELDPGQDVRGQVISHDDTKRPRHFSISFKDKTCDDFFQVLAHEMVHLKQYVKNEMYKCLVMVKGKPKVVTKWFGEIWVPKKFEDEYFDAPWELEAFGREVGLYHKWWNLIHDAR